MILVSVTRLRIRSLRFLPGFAYFSLLSFIQAKRSNGCVHARAVRETGLVFWTISLREEEAAMRVYRNKGSHAVAMPKLAEWCDEATVVHWRQENEVPPTLLQAHAHLISEGKVSKVRFPTTAHGARDFSAPKE